MRLFAVHFTENELDRLRYVLFTHDTRTDSDDWRPETDSAGRVLIAPGLWYMLSARHKLDRASLETDPKPDEDQMKTDEG